MFFCMSHPAEVPESGRKKYFHEIKREIRKLILEKIGMKSYINRL